MENIVVDLFVILEFGSKFRNDYVIIFCGRIRISLLGAELISVK